MKLKRKGQQNGNKHERIRRNINTHAVEDRKIWFLYRVWLIFISMRVVSGPLCANECCMPGKKKMQAKWRPCNTVHTHYTQRGERQANTPINIKQIIRNHYDWNLFLCAGTHISNSRFAISGLRPKSNTQSERSSIEKRDKNQRLAHSKQSK